MVGAVSHARSSRPLALGRTVLIAVLTLAMLPFAAAQTYRLIGTAGLEVDGVVKHFEAYEVSSEYRTVFTATWETGGFIAGDTYWIDVVMWERDDAEAAPGEGESMLAFRFFVDPATGEVVAPTWLQEPDINFVPVRRDSYPLYENFPDQTQVTLDALEWEGDVLSIQGSAVAVLGLVAEYESEGPDPTQTITVEIAFDLWEVVEIEY